MSKSSLQIALLYTVTFISDKVYYNAVPDYVHGSDKKAYLRDNAFAELRFEAIHPDKNHNWLNLAKDDWSELIPIASKDTKFGKGQSSQQAVFRTFSLGVVTSRDEWVYSWTTEDVEHKVKHLIKVYNQETDRLAGISEDDVGNQVEYSIKWTRAVKRDLASGKKYKYDRARIVDSLYRPFTKMQLYFSKELNEMQYLMPRYFFGENTAILFSGPNSPKPFTVLSTNIVPDLNSLSPAADGCRVLPLYDYTAQGERVDNITDWALEQFRAHYRPDRSGRPVRSSIDKLDIFYYVYAVLHHPAYREKYALNLKREFPRIPFYDDFRQWVKWGKALMDLHLHYESAKPYRLKREDKDLTGLRRTEGSPDLSGLPRPRLVARKESGAIEIDTVTTLRGVPPEAWQYQLGTYSALEWVLERYKEREPRDPTIREKFNAYRFADYKEHVIDLLRRVCTVSVETMSLIGQMPAA